MSQGTGKEPRKQVIDFTEVRAKKLEEKRRKTERIFFKHVMGIYSVSDNEDMVPIEIIDVSAEGLSFQVLFNPEKPWPKNSNSIPIRFYFSQDTYLPLVLQVQNSRPCINDGRRYVRYGCTVDKSLSSYEAYKKFVLFLEAYSEHAHSDVGKVTHFYI